jgi:hypothetical protein
MAGTLSGRYYTRKTVMKRVKALVSNQKSGPPEIAPKSALPARGSAMTLDLDILLKRHLSGMIMEDYRNDRE